jgi:hypothetical protein
MKPWATLEERAWLKEKLPSWYKARRLKKVADWLTTTTNEFVTAFPTRKPTPAKYGDLHSVRTFTS